MVLDFNQYESYYNEKYLSRLHHSTPSRVAEGPGAKPRSNAYSGFLVQEEDRCSYMLQQQFNVEDSRGAPLKQLELRSYVSLVPLMHGHADDGKARTQWMVWEDGFLEWVSMQNDVPSTICCLINCLVTHGARCVEFLIKALSKSDDMWGFSPRSFRNSFEVNMPMHESRQKWKGEEKFPTVAETQFEDSLQDLWESCHGTHHRS